MGLEIQNKCLLSKWLFKLINEDGLWQEILKHKYLGSKTISQVEKKIGDSHFWFVLMEVKKEFLQYVTFNLPNGEHIRFWEDKWLGNTSFSAQYPAIYNLVIRKHVIVKKVMSLTPLDVSIRRALSW